MSRPVIKIRVCRPPAWLSEDAAEFADFLDSTSGRKLCARARWLHLNLASTAVQSPQNPAAMDAARGSAETLRFLQELSGLTELPDLLPDHAASSDAEQSETIPSLHSLLTHTLDA